MARMPNNLTKSLMINFGTNLKETCGNNANNVWRLTIKDNSLNRFKDTLEACAVAGGLNRELQLNPKFHPNKHGHVFCD